MRTAAIFLGLGAVFLAATALADSSGPGALADQRASTVRTIRVDAHGRRTGIVLNDGTELVSLDVDEIARVVQPGDRVWVAVGPADTLQLVDWTRQKAVIVGARDAVDLGPFLSAPIGGGPRDEQTDRPPVDLIDDTSKLPLLVQDGRVALLTRSPLGVVSGFILDDGTQVHVIPRVSDVIAKQVHVGDVLHVEGPGRTSDDGRGMWAIAISRPNRLVLLDLMRGPLGVPELGRTKSNAPP